MGSVCPVATLDDLALALSLADRADEITREFFRRTDLHTQTKADLSPVTEADQSTERALRDLIARQRPEDGIVGEEYGVSDGGGRRWIIDPIDGTKNYVRGVPVWATLIGLADGDSVIVGVVSAPALGRRWWAAQGSGSWTQGPEDAEPRANRVSSVSLLESASLSFSDGTDWPEGALVRLMDSVGRSRAYGDFWSHMLVAEGVVDVAAEPVLNIWDVAALVPIIHEAGGRITAFDGGDLLTGAGAVTTNALLHDAVVRVIHD